jgi:hypothetical protein
VMPRNAAGSLYFRKHFAIQVQSNRGIAKRDLPAPPLKASPLECFSKSRTSADAGYPFIVGRLIPNPFQSFPRHNLALRSYSFE